MLPGFDGATGGGREGQSATAAAGWAPFNRKWLALKIADAGLSRRI
jgi:hypothetical protein